MERYEHQNKNKFSKEHKHSILGEQSHQRKDKNLAKKQSYAIQKLANSTIYNSYKHLVVYADSTNRQKKTGTTVLKEIIIKQQVQPTKPWSEKICTMSIVAIPTRRTFKKGP